MEAKNVKDLKRQNIILTQKINHLYTICGALYQEIQDVKRHTDYKKDEAAMPPQPGKNISAVNVLNDIAGYADSLPIHRGKVKVINN